MTNDEKLELRCQHQCDQNWRRLQEMIPHLLRISEKGPLRSDRLLVQQVFGLVAYEACLRKEAAEKEDGK